MQEIHKWIKLNKSTRNKIPLLASALKVTRQEIKW